jgi:hypothetical protein
MRAEIIRKKMQKTVLKQGVQINVMVNVSTHILPPASRIRVC